MYKKQGKDYKFKLKDGVITDDSNPVSDEELKDEGAIHKNMGKSSMSFATALFLSFNNLRTKLARTLLVAFAGSIGIIGIALILSLSNGVDVYIKTVEEETDLYSLTGFLYEKVPDLPSRGVISKAEILQMNGMTGIPYILHQKFFLVRA